VAESVTPFHDFGSYEMYLPEGFDTETFRKKAARGTGHFWLVELSDDEGMLRFKGVYFPTWERVILDIDPDSNTAYTPMKEELSLKIAKALNATNVFKDGVEIKHYAKNTVKKRTLRYSTKSL
jgi:hypothetical protein